MARRTPAEPGRPSLEETLTGVPGLEDMDPAHHTQKTGGQGKEEDLTTLTRGHFGEVLLVWSG